MSTQDEAILEGINMGKRKPDKKSKAIPDEIYEEALNSVKKTKRRKYVHVEEPKKNVIVNPKARELYLLGSNDCFVKELKEFKLSRERLSRMDESELDDLYIQVNERLDENKTQSFIDNSVYGMMFQGEKLATMTGVNVHKPVSGTRTCWENKAWRATYERVKIKYILNRIPSASPLMMLTYATVEGFMSAANENKAYESVNTYLAEKKTIDKKKSASERKVEE